MRALRLVYCLHQIADTKFTASLYRLTMLREELIDFKVNKLIEGHSLKNNFVLKVWELNKENFYEKKRIKERQFGEIVWLTNVHLLS